MQFVLIFIVLFQTVELPQLLTDKYAENKVLIIFAPDNRDPDYETVLLNLAKDPLGIDERNIVIFELFVEGGLQPDNTPMSEEEVGVFRKIYQAEAERFQIILLNEEKAEIHKSADLMNSKEIFSIFDQQ